MGSATFFPLDFFDIVPDDMANGAKSDWMDGRGVADEVWGVFA